jgi:hypothetical protein
MIEVPQIQGTLDFHHQHVVYIMICRGTKQYSVVQCGVFSPQSMPFPIVWCVFTYTLQLAALTTNLQSTIDTHTQ